MINGSETLTPFILILVMYVFPSFEQHVKDFLVSPQLENEKIKNQKNDEIIAAYIHTGSQLFFMYE